MLAVQMQGRAAGDEHLQPWRGGQQIGDQRRGVQHLLEVIEQQQHPFRTKEGAQALLDRPGGDLDHAERVGDRRGDQVWVADRREVDEEDTIGE